MSNGFSEIRFKGMKENVIKILEHKQWKGDQDDEILAWLDKLLIFWQGNADVREYLFTVQDSITERQELIARLRKGKA